MRSIEERGFRRLLRLHGRDLKLTTGISAGVVFRAVVDRMGEITLTTEIGKDMRGRKNAEALRNGMPEMAQGDRLQDVKSNEQYTAVDLDLESPDYSQKFILKDWQPELDT